MTMLALAQLEWDSLLPVLYTGHLLWRVCI